MEKDLKEALEMVETLMANLQLAHFERGYLTSKEVNKSLKEAAKLLRKNGVHSEMVFK